MVFHEAHPVWATAAASVALVLVAAKFHGRQVRLERELEGHHEVEFGGDRNPPFVLALWRRDRIQYWTTLAAVAVALAGAVVLGATRAGWAPMVNARPDGAEWFGVLAVTTLLWAPAVAFGAGAATSLAVLLRRLRATDPDTGRPRLDAVRAARASWLRDAQRGTLGWGAAYVLLLLLVAWLAA